MHIVCHTATGDDQDGIKADDESDLGDGGDETLLCQGLDDSAPGGTDLGEQHLGDDSASQSIIALGKYTCTVTCQ